MVKVSSLINKAITYVTKSAPDEKQAAEDEVYLLLVSLAQYAEAIAPMARKAKAIEARIKELSLQYHIKMDIGDGITVNPVYPIKNREEWDTSSLLAIAKVDSSKAWVLEYFDDNLPPQSPYAKVTPKWSSPPKDIR